jgi:hypothetical protein
MSSKQERTKKNKNQVKHLERMATRLDYKSESLLSQNDIDKEDLNIKSAEDLDLDSNNTKQPLMSITESHNNTKVEGLINTNPDSARKHLNDKDEIFRYNHEADNPIKKNGHRRLKQSTFINISKSIGFKSATSSRDPLMSSCQLSENSPSGDTDNESARMHRDDTLQSPNHSNPLNPVTEIFNASSGFNPKALIDLTKNEVDNERLNSGFDFSPKERNGAIFEQERKHAITKRVYAQMNSPPDLLPQNEHLDLRDDKIDQCTSPVVNNECVRCSSGSLDTVELNDPD